MAACVSASAPLSLPEMVRWPLSLSSSSWWSSQALVLGFEELPHAEFMTLYLLYQFYLHSMYSLSCILLSISTVIYATCSAVITSYRTAVTKALENTNSFH